MQRFALPLHLRGKLAQTMKPLTKLILLFIGTVAAGCFFGSCRDKVFEEFTYEANVPIYVDFATFRASVKNQGPRALNQPGKIYFYNNFLFVSEIQQGIHVIDNTNPAVPVNIAFVEIPGNIDMAIRGNVLYADSFIDLVAIDISDPGQPVEISRVKDAFPNVLPAMDITYPVYGLDFNKGIVVGWEKKEVTEVVERDGFSRRNRVCYDYSGTPSLGSAEVGLVGSANGIAGSMARFTLIGNYLYAAHNTALKVFDVRNTLAIEQANDVQLERVAETIYPFEGRLFLGTTTGMLVYELNNPAKPKFVSVFEHITSCDPVVVSGQYAFVTLRSGNNCNSLINQLDVIDISSVEHPFLVYSMPLYNPHGLGVDGNLLFICDGDAGLKVYDKSDPMNIHLHQLAHFDGIHSYDVIPHNGLLMMIGANGLYQYDYSTVTDLRLLSKIPVLSTKP